MGLFIALVVFLVLMLGTCVLALLWNDFGPNPVKRSRKATQDDRDDTVSMVATAAILSVGDDGCDD